MAKYAHVTGFADDGSAIVMGKNSDKYRKRCQEAIKAAEGGDKRMG